MIDIPTYIPTYIHTYIHTHTYTHIHTYINTYILYLLSALFELHVLLIDYIQNLCS